MKRLHPLPDLNAAPVELARELCWLEGFVFFDSSGNVPKDAGSAISIIAALPREQYRELQALNTAYRALSKGALALPESVRGLDGMLLGGLGYEGEMLFSHYEDLLIFDHESGLWYGKGQLLDYRKPQPLPNYEISQWQAGMNAQDYIQRVLRIQEYIKAGDIYQANLSQQFSARVSGEHLFSLYLSLRAAAPAPMAAYARWGDCEILCSSPETFLKMDQSTIETRPIKGTIKRCRDDAATDLRAMERLQQSPKERAELIMITDLLRNDLGKIATIGSVSVPELLKLETLAHVHHLVSVVTATLRQDIGHPAALASCSPGGSITGAPKKRAMEIINELESVPRGPYTGTMGYFGLSGASQFNIIIRTLVRRADQLSYHVGAGIVAGSDAQAEYEETLHKAEGIRAALGD